MALRDANIDDIEAIAHIRRVVHPYRVYSIEEQRHRFGNVPAKAKAQTLVAEEEGRVVGFARSMLNFGAAADDDGKLELAVLPEHRRQGIGSTLAGAAHHHLAAIGASVCRVWGGDDEATAGFATRHGYEAARAMRYSGLDPRDLPPRPALPHGVELVTVSEAGIDAVYAFDCVASLDEPSDVAPEMIPLEDWVSFYWKAPGHHADLGIMAIVDGLCVAGTFVEADLATGRSWSGFTGTLPDHRGRGLAKLVKHESLRRVAAAGITAAYTSNDAVNAPMLAVNTWLGYRETATERSFNKNL